MNSGVIERGSLWISKDAPFTLEIPRVLGAWCQELGPEIEYIHFIIPQTRGPLQLGLTILRTPRTPTLGPRFETGEALASGNDIPWCQKPWGTIQGSVPRCCVPDSLRAPLQSCMWQRDGQALNRVASFAGHLCLCCVGGPIQSWKASMPDSGTLHALRIRTLRSLYI